MTHEESITEAARLLSEAGWRPIIGTSMAGRFVAPELGLVGGRPPCGAEGVVKCWTAIPPGHELYDENTPDEPHEAAAWLVARYPRAPAPEAEETPAHEAHGETGEAEEADLLVHASGNAVSEDAGQAGNVGAGGEPEVGHTGLGEGYLDADFAPLPELGQELTEEHPEEFGGSQFIFGDNLAQKRTAAIGLVMQRARALMPFWSTNHDTALKELRNFVMGVSENRWPDDPERRDELDQLEGTRRRINAIEAARDAKVAFLESATREEVEAFDPEADWP